MSLLELEQEIPKIIERDKKLSTECDHSHYRYYSGNPNYFELKI